GRRRLATRRSAHAVRDGREAITAGDRVLVRVSDATDIGSTRGDQSHGVPLSLVCTIEGRAGHHVPDEAARDLDGPLPVGRLGFDLVRPGVETLARTIVEEGRDV